MFPIDSNPSFPIRKLTRFAQRKVSTHGQSAPAIRRTTVFRKATHVTGLTIDQYDDSAARDGCTRVCRRGYLDADVLFSASK